MKANTPIERLFNGIVKENPTLVLLLGMCPTLAVTTSAINGAGMGLTTTAVLMLSNAIISALRKIIPDRVRIPAYIVIVASLVTIVQFLLEAYIPALNASLGLYIPLIVVNCIILGRAESYAAKNPVIPSFFDGIGMGLGFTCSLTVLGACREILGAGQIFGFQILPEGISATIFILAPGAFLVLAFLIAIMNRVNRKKAEKAGKQYEPIQGCGDCQNCSNGKCSSKFYDTDVK
ncbi:MAG: electron transport complex subunit E [Clostridiales bacterium]|nr:electron transport complex subunit E [Clostridiales bacterium]